MYRVILAEDEELVRRALLATTDWESHGFAVVAAAKDGSEAFAQICAAKPDLVVTDIRMPMLDGISLVRMVREELPADERPFFVILTAHGDFDYARQAVKLDVIDFLTKPLDDAELAATLDKARARLDERNRSRRLETMAALATNNAPLGDFAAETIPPSRDHSDAYADRAAEEISSRFVQNVTVEDVAAKLGISSGYLSKVFKKRTGKTFYDYLAFVRMREAMELLLDPTIRVQEVADRVGYADQRYFSQKFRAIVGCTPSEFRQGRVGHATDTR